MGVAAFHETLAEVLRVAGNCELAGVVLTHAHADHMGGVPRLARERPGLPVWKLEPPEGLQTNCLGSWEDDLGPKDIWEGSFTPLRDGEVLRTEGASLRVLHTPGHANDHVCLLLEEEWALFTGDHILGVGTVVVKDLNLYLASLKRLDEAGPRRIYPGHGPMLDGDVARERPKEYIGHRLARVESICRQLADPPCTADGKRAAAWTARAISKLIYGDRFPKDELLQEAACLNTLRALEKLERDGRARCEGARDHTGLWLHEDMPQPAPEDLHKASQQLAEEQTKLKARRAEEMEGCRQIFRFFDADGDGLWSLQEARAFWEALQLTFMNAFLDKYWHGLAERLYSDPAHGIRADTFYRYALAGEKAQLPKLADILAVVEERRKREPQLWVVVGGGDKGGIVVRKDFDLASAERPRLATGAKVQELERRGDRLKFLRVEGGGPDVGWVSIRMKDKELLRRLER